MSDLHELENILDASYEDDLDREDQFEEELENDFEGDLNEEGNAAFPNKPQSIEESIQRLDALIKTTQGEDKIRAGLGIRLALGMAQELKSGQELGNETAELVSTWVLQYGSETVNGAVEIARQFLTKPEDMRKALGERLGLEEED